MKISCFEDLKTQAQTMPQKTVIAVVEAHDAHTLESVVQATTDGMVIPLLIGDAEKIKDLLRSYTADTTAFRIVSSLDPDESLRTAITLIHSGEATAIMKGKLETKQLMKAIVKKENGLLAGSQLSLIGFYETPQYHKLFAVSDFGINTYPDLTLKKTILENAVHLLHTLGNDNPKVAILSSIETVNPKMPDTLDGDALKKMNQKGVISGCTVEGPISFDLATSREAAQVKGFDSPVAGDADILIVPDIVSGNILVKCLTGFGGAKTAGTVLGAKVPIILTSRAAEASDKYYSIALAACAAARY